MQSIRKKLNGFATIILGFSATFFIGCDQKPTTKIPTAGTSMEVQAGELFQKMQSADSEVSEAVDKLFNAITQEKTTELYQASTSPKFQEIATLEKFEAICKRIRTRLGALTGKESAGFNLNPVESGYTVTATYQAEFEKGAGTIMVRFEEVNGEWLLLRLSMNAPELLDDPTKFRKKVEIHFKNVEPVLPGTTVDVFDASNDPATLLAQNVPVLNVRWKVSNPFKAPTFPASGFVLLSLTQQQAQAIQAAKTLTLQQHKSTGETADTP